MTSSLRNHLIYDSRKLAQKKLRSFSSDFSLFNTFFVCFVMFLDSRIVFLLSDGQCWFRKMILPDKSIVRIDKCTLCTCTVGRVVVYFLLDINDQFSADSKLLSEWNCYL